MIKDVKVTTRLLLSFGLASFFIILVGGYGAMQMKNLADLTAKMYRHPLTVSNAVRDVQNNIIEMHLYMKDVALAKSDSQLEKAVLSIDLHETTVYKRFDLIKARFLGDQKDVDALIDSFRAWKNIRDEIIELTREGQYDEAAQVSERKGVKHIQLLENKMKVLVNFASNKADEFMENADNQENTAYKWVFSLITIVTLIMIITGFATWRLINQSFQLLKQSVNMVNAVAEGKLNNMVETDREDEIGQLSQAFSEMQTQLRAQIDETIKVLRQLGEGRTDIQIEGKFAGDFANLKTALESTATQLAEVKVKNETEKWLKTGQAQLNEQVSGEQSIKQLAETVINFLTPYVDAQVGIFHLLEQSENTEPYLKVIASHAYVRRSHHSDVTQMGEGIVGQAAYEGKLFTISRTVEENIHVQSSIQDESPKEIVVIPFLYENNLKGVIELASLQAFTEVHLEFLKQVMPNIGIAINTAESRAQVQLLLQQSQNQA